MGNNLLKGKRGIVFGALNDMSIAWKVAERVVEEGATITLSNTPLAVRMGTTNELAEKLNVQVIPADATSVTDLEQVFAQSMEILGGRIDFVLHSIGMSPNVRKKRTYDDLDYDMLTTTLDISAISFHKMLQVAKKMNAINDYGSIVALSYMAAQRTVFGYNDMADAKSMLESIARSFGYIYGREHNVRVNTISQSPTVTTAGSGVKGMDGLLDFSERMSPLGNATAADCADYCVVMFSDLTRKVTMQNLLHDGGFSSMAMSYRAMEQYNKSFDEFKDEKNNLLTITGYRDMKLRMPLILLFQRFHCGFCRKLTSVIGKKCLYQNGVIILQIPKKVHIIVIRGIELYGTELIYLSKNLQKAKEHFWFSMELTG